jgi:hypothetical protein
MNSAAYIKLCHTASLNFLSGDWFNVDTHEFCELRAENGFWTSERDYFDRTVEIFVVTTGPRQGVWQHMI